MKIGKKFVSLALAGMLLLAGCGSGSGATYATVNGDKIPKAKYESQLDLYKSMIAAQYRLPSTIRESLIQEQVMLQDLKKNKVELTDKDFAVEYDKAVKAYGGAANYSNTLKQLGVTDEQLKESLRFETISRKHKALYNEQHKPSDAEIKQYFDKNKDALVTVEARHILVKTEDEAKKVKERLAKGEKFEDVAKAVSLDKGSAENGGSLGSTSPSKFVNEFKKAILEQKVGEIGNPVKTQFGYHIIQVQKRNDTVEALKDKIIEKLNGEKYTAYLQKLVQDADVKIEGESASQASTQDSAKGSAQEPAQASTQESAAPAESSAAKN